MARADVTNDIYFRVLRRVIGDTDWTLLTDEIHGTATEYTYTDDRPLAGSYYEYSVQAYGAKCDEQIVKTDEVIAPGFSQARGTITGHISYGSGTAVDGVKREPRQGQCRRADRPAAVPLALHRGCRQGLAVDDC